MLAIMGTRIIAGSVLAGALMLAVAGCAAPSDVTAAAKETETPAPPPTTSKVVESTPEQVASVIAKYESGWREAADNAIDCRTSWVLDGNVLGNGSCYNVEKTAVTTATLALREWEALDIPADLSAIVAETTGPLTVLSESGLSETCGDDLWPVDTEPCSQVLADVRFAYRSLETQLDAWRPYL